MGRLLTVLILPPVFSLAILIAARIGHFLPPPTAFSGLDDCRLPCWQGILPGDTSLSQTDDVLSTLGFAMSLDNPRQGYSIYSASRPSTICAAQVYYERGIAKSLILTPCQPVALGDWITLLGIPQNVALSNTNPLMRDRAVMLIIPRTDCTKWPMSPFARVEQVYLSVSNPRFGLAQVSLTWHGFIPYWRFRKFEPMAPVC